MRWCIAPRPRGGANKYAASFASGWPWLDLNFMQNNDPANVSEPLLSSPDERMNPRLFPPFVAPPCRHEPLALPQESAGDVGFDRRGQGSEGIVRPAESPCGAVTGSFEGASSCYTSALELSLP